jgi:hypothetical protein
MGKGNDSRLILGGRKNIVMLAKKSFNPPDVLNGYAKSAQEIGLIL